MDNEGQRIWDSTELEAMVMNFFKQLYTDDGCTVNINLSELIFPTLEAHKVASLGKSFTMEEVFTTLKDMEPYKAPGTDGFHAVFFQKNWNMVGKTTGRCV